MTSCFSFSDLSVHDAHDAVDAVDELFIVRAEEEGHVLCAVQFKEKIDDHVSRLGVEIRGGFVGEDQRGMRDEGPRDRDPLTLAA